MKCDICKRREATVHLTEVINSSVTKLHLCEECAQAKSAEMQSHFGLSDLLSGLMDFEPSISGEKGGTQTQIKCTGCGMTYYDFQKIGKLGCGKCYEVFSEELGELLKKIHGSDRHRGKIPGLDKKPVRTEVDLCLMKEELQRYIKTEEFEKAAVLRDRIKELQNKLEE
ncbi:MAG: UvrB/UvrC motif-containing protein [Candidatus Omnitrophota bacterium]